LEESVGSALQKSELSSNSEDSPLKQVFDYIDSNKDTSLEALRRLAKQPSVSAKSEGIRECAMIVRDMLENLGATPKILEVEGANPLVCGEIRSKANPGKTVLFYNHYDVQPAEPLELWNTPAFEPTIKDGKVYGRGVADDKGELVGRVKLTEAFLKTMGDVPCNFKFLFEGEEEIGSIHLHEYAKNFPDAFRADATVWEFGKVDAKERPEIILGVKGILYVELTARNANKDAHSSFAAVVQNPAWRLVWALNTLKRGEKILVPGWYDDVRPLTKEELELVKSWPFPEKELREELGISKFVNGIRGLEVKKDLVGKPTCTICGINSGWTGPGSKTVLPKDAMAKIDFRLVPDQDPDKLVKKLKSHLKAKGFADVEVTYSEGEKAARTSPKEAIARSAVESARRVFQGKKPVVVVSSAGTGPMYLFDSPCVCIGGGYEQSRAHSPNENLRIDLFLKSQKWVADTVATFALQGPR
jgi:acetylornithine deacetylase/succinyl-diaminopimelate desuccinylase-like protein